jgi:uncharacterized repeat protein (TIGR01451 family)
MRCRRVIGIRYLPLLGIATLVGLLLLPVLSIAQPPSGNGQLVIVSDEGQAQTLFPGQVVREDTTLLQSSDVDPDPNWRNRDFNDGAWTTAFPVLRVTSWATTTLAGADHIWGGTAGGLLTDDDGSGTTTYPNRFDGADYDNGYPIASSPVPQYLFLRKNFCIPINTLLDGSGDPTVSAGGLSLLPAVDGNVALWLNGLYSLWSGAGDESGSLASVPMPPNIAAVLERGNNTLSMRAGESDPNDQAALLYRWDMTYTIDPNAIQINASANPAYVGQSVDFSYTDDGLSSRPPYGAVWDFGDASGDTSSPHIYSAAGTYTVTLTLTDQDGCPGVAVYAITVLDVSQLLISKVADRATAVVGDVVQFDLTVQNSGAAQSLTSVVVSDTVPTGTNFVWCSGGCTQVGGDVRWDLGTLAPGETRTLQLRVQIDPAFTGNQIVNSYRASSVETGLVLGADVTVLVIQPATATPTNTPIPPDTPTPTNTPIPADTPTSTPGPPPPPPPPGPGPGPAPTSTPTPIPTLTPTVIVLLPPTGGGGEAMPLLPWALLILGAVGLLVIWSSVRSSARTR